MWEYSFSNYCVLTDIFLYPKLFSTHGMFINKKINISTGFTCKDVDNINSSLRNNKIKGYLYKIIDKLK